MSHRTPDIVVNHANIKQVIDSAFRRDSHSRFKVRPGSKWKPRMIAAAALLWATGKDSTLGARFILARKIVAKVFRWQAAPGDSYQGFIFVLRQWHKKLKQVLIPHLRSQMKVELSSRWLVAGYPLFAGDGSRVGLSRTASLEKAFSPKPKPKAKKAKANPTAKAKKSPANKIDKAEKAAQKKRAEAAAKKRSSPQMWLTLLWHVGTGLPWAWRTGPSDSSERDHLKEMLKDELPENSLITADAGFVGYKFWTDILDAGHHFVIRVGANVRLLKGLGFARQYDHTVYLWPDQQANKKQPPLVLRLIVINNGRHPVYLVTDLLKSELSDAQAAAVYQARWGIELFFRTFKQTFGCRKLHSRSAKNADLEMDWALLGLWCICFLGQRELAGNGEDISRLSPAAAIEAFQTMLNDYRVRPESHADTLWEKLRVALLDDYQRKSSKTSRSYPTQKKQKAIGSPKITKATTDQIEAAQQLKLQQREIHFTA